MGDSIDMTVAFLRARLLSERSVSRAARQRAEQLAKRVIELEEQLRIVTIQRKKAEKAAAEVLAILETQGIGDLSEAIDSSSDGEIPFDDTQEEHESSTASRIERSEEEDGLSGSEPEVSPSQGRSLSWKSHSNSPNSHDKQRAKQTRQRQRRRSFMTALQSSSKHQLGKSRRKKMQDQQQIVRYISPPFMMCKEQEVLHSLNIVMINLRHLWILPGAWRMQLPTPQIPSMLMIITDRLKPIPVPMGVREMRRWRES